MNTTTTSLTDKRLCECGRMVRRYNRKNHEDTIYHKKRALQKQGVDEKDPMFIHLYYTHSDSNRRKTLIDNMKKRLMNHPEYTAQSCLVVMKE